MRTANTTSSSRARPCPRSRPGRFAAGSADRTSSAARLNPGPAHPSSRPRFLSHACSAGLIGGVDTTATGPSRTAEPEHIATCRDHLPPLHTTVPARTEIGPASRRRKRDGGVPSGRRPDLTAAAWSWTKPVPWSRSVAAKRPSLESRNDVSPRRKCIRCTRERHRHVSPNELVTRRGIPDPGPRQRFDPGQYMVGRRRSQLSHSLWATPTERRFRPTEQPVAGGTRRRPRHR